MTAAERQQVIDIVDLQINRYFDHYLSDTFPKQLDRLFKNHNSDGDAHPAQFKVLSTTSTKVARVTWMVAGMSALLGFALTAGALVSYWWRLP